MNFKKLNDIFVTKSLLKTPLNMVVWASTAVSLDGYIDNCAAERLLLSSKEDWDAVRALRAECDAILVGAETVRKDNPALVTRSQTLRRQRITRGVPPDPIKITVTASGHIDPQSRFFTEGEGQKIVIAGSNADPHAITTLRIAGITLLQGSSPQLTPHEMLTLLRREGIHTLFLEGGSSLLTAFLSADCVDFLRLAVAPFFVGEPQAPRFVNAAHFPHDFRRRMLLRSTTTVGDMAVMLYALKASAEDYRYLEQAIELADRCPQSSGAYSVGALIVCPDGKIFTGYSRETAPANHAEEEAILKAQLEGHPLQGATIYSSMEPCSTRKSKSVSCSELIIRHRFKRVVFASYEPATFVQCNGEQLLHKAGIDVTILNDLNNKVLKTNKHIK